MRPTAIIVAAAMACITIGLAAPAKATSDTVIVCRVLWSDKPEHMHINPAYSLELTRVPGDEPRWKFWLKPNSKRDISYFGACSDLFCRGNGVLEDWTADRVKNFEVTIDRRTGEGTMKTALTFDAMVCTEEGRKF